MFVWPEPDTEFNSAVLAPGGVDQASNQAWYFVFKGSELLQHFDADGQWQPVSTLPRSIVGEPHYLGDIKGIHCYAVEVDHEDGEFSGLRSLFGKSDNFLFSLAGRAAQVVDWYRTHQYCGKCGQKTEPHDKDRAMVCAPCRSFYYPRLSPSIITLVHRGEEMLLARNHNFPKSMYSTLAGFVEPGESVEQTLIREVKEEVGVTVNNLEYLGSQPWPFPNSLMLGFLAEYESGDIVLQEDEIADAKWFHHTDLPTIPGGVAISRWLIDAHLSRVQS